MPIPNFRTHQDSFTGDQIVRHHGNLIHQWSLRYFSLEKSGGPTDIDIHGTTHLCYRKDPPGHQLLRCLYIMIISLSPPLACIDLTRQSCCSSYFYTALLKISSQGAVLDVSFASESFPIHRWSWDKSPLSVNDKIIEIRHQKNACSQLDKWSFT